MQEPEDVSVNPELHIHTADNDPVSWQVAPLPHLQIEIAVVVKWRSAVV